MKMLRMFLIVMLASGAALATNAGGGAASAGQDQVPKSIAESVKSTLEFVEGDFLGVAEAMPESKYSFVPAAGNFDGVRTFA